VGVASHGLLSKEALAMLHPSFVDHLVFRVAGIERTERFYNAILGQPLKEEDYLMYMAGDTRLFFTSSAAPQQGTYDKEKIGLNHIALAYAT
jgi:glyoxylase I family protein